MCANFCMDLGCTLYTLFEQVIVKLCYGKKVKGRNIHLKYFLNHSGTAIQETSYNHARRAFKSRMRHAMDMPAYIGFWDIFSTTQPDSQYLLQGDDLLGLNPWRACYWVVPVDDCTSGPRNGPVHVKTGISKTLFERLLSHVWINIMVKLFPIRVFPLYHIQ